MTTIYQLGNFRIQELKDADYCFDDLKGDMYDPSLYTDFDKEVLREEERAFERLVEQEGVYGYILERWNPDVGCGWEEIDACWGFVGCHATQGHYIVEEFIEQILALRREQGI